MTIGEKIQHYRKKQGLSQEDLGQKLMVSRQTISLWEMDKTVPSIDNLIRLKDIFGVSIDEILCGEEAAEKEEAKPLESYTVNFTKKEAKHLYFHGGRIILRSLLSAIAVILLILFISLFDYTAVIKGILIGVVAMALAANIKTWILKNQVIERVSQSTYVYDIYEDYLTFTVKHGDKRIRIQKVKAEDIKRVQYGDRNIVLQINNELFAIKRDLLPESSGLYTFIKLATAKAPMPRAKVKWRALSIILFIASILSIFLALLSISVASTINGKHVQNMWLFFLYLPIPIASVIFYALLKRKGIVFKKNLIVGIIMSAFLCIYGSFALFPEKVSVNGVYEVSVENVLSETYDSPNVIKVFALKKADVYLETICIFQTDDKGLVVGALYGYDGDETTYFNEFASDVEIGERYYTSGYVCDYDIGYQIYETRKDAPDISYELQEITVDGEKYYFCVGYIGHYMSDETHWVTE